MGASGYHEPFEKLRAETREMHRALVSLMEELEAVDWYAQRIDATDDPELAKILEHNRDEEKEHACMMIEWIRKRDEGFDRYLRQFLFQDGSTDPASDAHEQDDATRGLSIGSLRRIGGAHGS